MVIKRCPQCGTASNDIYGFCIKCGYEFPEMKSSKGTCPLCGYQNPEEADFCVKCGTPLIFKNSMEDGKFIQPIVIKKTGIGSGDITFNQKLIIVFGYFFSILGGILGIIIAIYLSTRKNPTLKRHGHIQLAIFAFYVALIAILFATGNIPADAVTNYQQLIAGNITSI